MAVEANANTNCILGLTPIRCASVCARIGVYTGLETLAVDIIDKRTQPVGEACGMNEQLAVLFASAEETVIYIYMIITAILEPELYHSVGLSLYYRVIDLETISIP